jgi:hypothetical protein
VKGDNNYCKVNMRKTILKFGILSVITFGTYFINVSEVKADCTMTSTLGTDGRCFSSDGEYVCLERSEDRHCFVPDTGGETPPVIGG